MTENDLLVQGRAALSERRWRDAFDLLTAAGGHALLSAEDLERLATAAYLLGDESSCTESWARAHDEFRDRGELARSARCAFWLGFRYINNGDMALAGGWFARGQRLIDDAALDCVERGYLLLPGAIQGCDDDADGSLATFLRASEIGERFRDRDLVAISTHGQGRALIRLGQPEKAMALLDEVLVAVATGELSAIVTGDVYCGVIEACYETFDVRRAREWTAALSRWCDSQPGLLPYRGQCLVYRAAMLQTNGTWSAAMEEALAALAFLSEPRIQPAIGAAHYQRAEIHRLRGEVAEAEEAYRKADQFGRDPQPGLALLRLGQGQTEAAAATMRRVLHEVNDRLGRSRLLGPAVEILLAVGDGAGARAASDELSGLAAASTSPYFQAVSAQATGAVLLAEGESRPALAALRKARSAWLNLEAPYEEACTRVLIGRCCRELGDGDGAELELRAARHAFNELGAAPDVGRVDSLLPPTTAPVPGGLSARELDVLRLVAQGMTNRAIGDELVISEKTVARHVSNIFSKLGVSSRAGATAYAFGHGLV